MVRHRPVDERGDRVLVGHVDFNVLDRRLRWSRRSAGAEPGNEDMGAAPGQ